MHPEIYIAVGGIFVAVSVVLAVALALRAPGRPKALGGDAVDQGVALLLTVLISFAIGNAITVFLDLRAGTYASVALATAITVVSGTIVWRVFRIRARLRQADAGLSPFRLPRSKDGLTPGGQSGSPLPA